MSDFIAKIHRYVRTARRQDSAPEWALAPGAHKAYGRMEKFPLPEPESGVTLAAALSGRHSASEGKTGESLSRKQFGDLLGLALRKRTEDGHPPYPSGGAKYPIEAYVICREFEGKQGAFHYNPTEHALEYLWESGVDLAELVANAPAFSSVLVLTAVWERSAVKYGDFAYLLALLEAGHMSQNVLLAASALGLRARPMMSFDDEKISTLLALDGEREQPVLSITLSA
jgi:SagB-type dehydrogenase family enzyme